MKKQEEEIILANEPTQKTNTIRVQKNQRKRQETTITRNKGVIGDSIELMIEKIRDGDGEDSILDRDLVYNDNESNTVNPITNIRSDKMELMLDEKIGEYEHKHRAKMKVVQDENKEENSQETTENTGSEGE